MQATVTLDLLRDAVAYALFDAMDICNAPMIAIAMVYWNSLPTPAK